MEDLNKWEKHEFLGEVSNKYIKMSIALSGILKFNTIPIKNLKANYGTWQADSIVYLE